jgi:FKBP-type peptidyl-prolyl cis-trans isomerase
VILRNKNIGLALLTGFSLIMCVSCNLSNDWEKWEKEEEAAIQQYLSAHPKDTFELKPSGLYYMDVVVGTGKLAETNDTSYVFYTGYYLNGTKFASNYNTDDTIICPLNSDYLFAGFKEALTYMRAGGQAKAIIPSDLACYDYIPRLYDIYLVKLVPGPGKGTK